MSRLPTNIQYTIFLLLIVSPGRGQESSFPVGASLSVGYPIAPFLHDFRQIFYDVPINGEYSLGLEITVDHFTLADATQIDLLLQSTFASLSTTIQHRHFGPNAGDQSARYYLKQWAAFFVGRLFIPSSISPYISLGIGIIYWNSREDWSIEPLDTGGTSLRPGAMFSSGVTINLTRDFYLSPNIQTSMGIGKHRMSGSSYSYTYQHTFLFTAGVTLSYSCN